MRHAVIALVLLLGQTAAKPAFEVATLKRDTSLAGGGSMNVDPGERFRAVNAPVPWLMAFAYAQGPAALRPEQLVGAPGWLDSEHYDINAKGAENATEGNPFNNRMRLMVQSLLEDRLKLRWHREQRQMPVYALVRATPDGSLGPRFKQSTPDCFKGTVSCGFMGGPAGAVKAPAISMDLLTQILAGAANRIVVDRSGLSGGFGIDLEYSPDQTASDKPSIFTAVQEQLGLKLEATSGPIDVIVIDHVEHPIED